MYVRPCETSSDVLCGVVCPKAKSVGPGVTVGFDCTKGLVVRPILLDGSDMFVVVLTLSAGFGGSGVGNYAPIIAILEEANTVTLIGNSTSSGSSVRSSSLLVYCCGTCMLE